MISLTPLRILVDEMDNRVAGFSVYVTSTNTTGPWSTVQQCYSNTDTIDLPDASSDEPLQVTCVSPMAGRYVTIYNERLPGKVYPSTWSNEAVLELCEVEVTTGKVCISIFYTKWKLNY